MWKKVVCKWEITNSVTKFVLFCFVWSAAAEDSSSLQTFVSEMPFYDKKSRNASDTLQRQRPKSNEEETISSCWLVTTIDQVLLVKVPASAMLSLWSHILNKWTLHHWQTQRDAGICLRIWKWTLTINGHLIAVTICTWTLWETRHHPKQPYIRPHPTTNLSTFQPNGH